MLLQETQRTYLPFETFTELLNYNPGRLKRPICENSPPPPDPKPRDSSLLPQDISSVLSSCGKGGPSLTKDPVTIGD